MIIDVKELDFIIDEIQECIDFQIDEADSIDFVLDDYVNIAPTYETYEGPYTVIPKVVDQMLATKDKLMLDDVTVTEIPYVEVSNIYGTTVSIATE